MTSAAAYAFGGACDAGHDREVDSTQGTIAAARYAGATVDRFVVTDAGIALDRLNVDELQTWFSGSDPDTGERRGRDLSSPATDLVFDATINAPKSFSLAAVLDPELNDAYEALQDRLRDRIITMWREELNSRRGQAGRERMDLAQIEVVELRHERSRALDAHKHRHLWLNAKVLGVDGKWSSIDSRVMLRFQNVVNAEGELAARTDPEWVAALAAKGYTIGDDGEIEQLATVVRPLSRRSNQIEANKAVRLAAWRAENPGQEPDRDVLTAIDRWAWAHQRPDKPGHVDEDEWLDTVRREIADIDPAAVAAGGRPPAPVTSVAIADIDRDDLAARAVADADNRAAGTGGRFSDFDLRAGVVRALAAAGVVADRAQLTELIEDVTARAATGSTVQVVEDPDMPGHVKHRMATRTAGAKLALADTFEKLSAPGEVIPSDTVAEVAAATLPAGRTLDAGQADAAAAIAGTDRLVTVTGPAGTGKTTMLQVARRLLENQGRRMVVVAPTKKAASVAGRETGAKASSLHGLLLDWGFRWEDSPTGQVWTRLVPGQIDPVTGTEYTGPRRFPLERGDRIVVDEAGMVDLHTANALAAITRDTGVGIAMVGDHLQALPVGHSGAMSLMRTRSTAVVELSSVHRFLTTDENGQPTKDTAWAELSLRVRDPGTNANTVAHEIIETGHAVVVTTDHDARAHMVEAWLSGHAAGERIALVTATHEESQTISETIQARRIQAGHLDITRPVGLQGGQVAYIGDIIQTRRNHRYHDVENRQQWTISDVTTTRDGTVLTARLVSVEDPGMTRDVDGDYLTDHAHLSYAATVHGVQGETTDRALVGPGVDAAGLYVGLTRGRLHNAAILVADSNREARAQLVETMQRGRIEATLDDARTAARLELSRAARRADTPVTDDGTPAPWHDRTARPLGTWARIDELLADAVDQEKSLYEQIARLGDTISVDQDALDELNVKIATWDAVSHAIAISDHDNAPAPLLLPAKDALDARLAAARAERADLSRAYGKITRRINDLQRESAIRERLGPDVTAYEDDARRRAIRTRFANEIPAWDDRARRPLGKVTALGAKAIATKNELDEVAGERDRRAEKIAAVQTMLRTDAGPDGIALTPEHRERITALLEDAQAGYDQVVDRHTKLTRLAQAVAREHSFREQLAADAAANAARVESLTALLEVGIDADGDILDIETRVQLAKELQTLSAQPDRAAAETQARHAPRRAAATEAPEPVSSPDRPTGPSLG
ncbi:AAA family ATPase [Microbacterium sp. NPDC055988]|uniref:AAA family ATPase n=1 Tax=Microbacterium sp. NPDC055988 TaxID=3345671 RepID=UPI0035DB5953